MALWCGSGGGDGISDTLQEWVKTPFWGNRRFPLNRLGPDTARQSYPTPKVGSGSPTKASDRQIWSRRKGNGRPRWSGGRSRWHPRTIRKVCRDPWASSSDIEWLLNSLFPDGFAEQAHTTAVVCHVPILYLFSKTMCAKNKMTLYLTECLTVQAHPRWRTRYS